MTDEKKQQYTLKISQASRTQLVVILYEMTLDYLKEAVMPSRKSNNQRF